MNIAQLGFKQLEPENVGYGGTEKVVLELSKRMAKLGNKVTCYSRSIKGKKNEPYIYEGINVIPVRTINKRGLAAFTSSYFATKKAIKSDVDVIHFHSEGPSIWTKMAKQHSNKKIIVTIHGLDWKRAKWGKIASAIIKTGEKNAVKYADEIIVLSKNVQEYFEKTYGRKTNFIPNGVEKPKILSPKIISSKFGLEKDSYILYLSRIVPEKRLDLLIKAYNNLDTNKKLVIAGIASDTDDFYIQIKKLSEKNKNIIFTGFASGDLKDELYSNALCYCLPSDVEGMALTLLEAMSFGNKCIVSDIKENTEVVENKALIFKHGNQKDLEEKLKLILENKDELKSKEEICNFITKKYSWDKATKETLKVYEK